MALTKANTPSSGARETLLVANCAISDADHDTAPRNDRPSSVTPSPHRYHYLTSTRPFAPAGAASPLPWYVPAHHTPCRKNNAHPALHLYFTQHQRPNHTLIFKYELECILFLQLCSTLCLPQQLPVRSFIHSRIRRRKSQSHAPSAPPLSTSSVATYRRRPHTLARWAPFSPRPRLSMLLS